MNLPHQYVYEYEYEMSLASAVFSILFVFCLFGQVVFFVVRTTLAHIISAIVVPRRSATDSSAKKTPQSQRCRWMLLCPSLSTATVTLGLLVVALELPLVLRHYNGMDSSSGLAHLIQGTDVRLNHLLERIPTLREGPQPPPSLLLGMLMTNRHLHFLPWLIQNELHQRPGIPYQRLHLPVLDWNDKSQRSNTCLPLQHQRHQQGIQDVHTTPTIATTTCQTGERATTTASATARRTLGMKDTITIDIFPPLQPEPGDYPSFNQSSPIIIFSPGLTCHSQDLPGNMIVRRAYERGFRSAVVNRRGHTPLQKLQSPRWNLFGDVDDLEQAYWFLKDQVAVDTPFFLHGISSGTALVVTALSKWDDRLRHRPELPTPRFVASVSVTPGYDTSRALARERFRFPYHDFLLWRVKDHFVRPNEAVLRQHDNKTVNKVLGTRNLQDFVNAAVRFAGYENATAYYQDTNPINDLAAITTPTLVLNSMDDPCCSIQNLFETSPYPSHNNKSYAEIISQSQNTLVAVTWTGSHCPFLSWSAAGQGSHRWGLPLVRDTLGGGWMLNSWADQVSVDFYHAALHVYGANSR